MQYEKEALSCVRSEIKLDNTELNVFIVSKTEQLQKVLAVENNLMDKLAKKSEKAKLLSVKLHYTNKHLDHLESKNTMIKSCVSEINQYLQRLI